MLTRQIVGQTPGQNWHYESRYEQGVPFLWHYHPEYELTLTRGACGMRYIGSDVAEFGLLDLALVSPNQAHTWYARPDASPDTGSQQVQVIFFTRDWLAELKRAGMPENLPFLDWLAGVGQGVVFSRESAASLVPVFEELHEARGLYRLSLLFQIFDALPRDVQARGIGGSVAGRVRDRRVELALGYLQEHYREPITLTALAEAAASSPTSLKRLFREQIGTSVTAVLQQLRLGHACHLLISTHLPVGLLAEQSGFRNPGNFYKQFAAELGVTPAEYRRRNDLRRAQSMRA